MFQRPISLLVLFVICITFNLEAQKEIEKNNHSSASDQRNVKSLFINSNNIRTILFNTGSISNPGVTGNVLDLVWNGLGYAYEIGFLAGSKVPSAKNPSDSIRIIIDGFGSSNRSTADGDFAPDGLTKWGWLPTARYSNPRSIDIANNQDPSTWPDNWNNWQGKYGNAIADMELVYEMNDSTDAEFPYYPNPADSSRRGLGLSLEAHCYQFSHPNLEDVLFSHFEISNVSSKQLTRMVAGISGDPHIGGANNYADDTQDFHSGLQLFYSWDPDKKGDIPIIEPGYFGMTLVASPDDKGITAYAALPFGGNNRPKNDSLIYETLSENSKNGSLFYSTDPSNLGDYILLFGSSFFSMNPGQKKAFGVAYVFGENLAELIERTTVVDREYPLRFSMPGSTVAITAPAAGEQLLSNTTQIQWTDPAMDNDSTISIYYSHSPNEKWIPISKNVTNNGLYQWDLSTLPDGIFYKLHLLKEKNGLLSYDSTDGFFTLNKPGDAAPEIRLLQPVNIKTLKYIYPIRWFAGDADGNPVTVKIFFSANDGFTYTLLAESANTGLFLFDTKKISNTSWGKIKLEAIANGKNVSVESRTFRIANDYLAITDSTILKHSNGNATGSVFPGIADSSAITGSNYRITFDSLNGTIRYTLKNLATNQISLMNEPLTANTGTGTLVDGLRIWFNNHPLLPDSVRSQFALPTENVSRKVLYTFGSLPRKHLPVDLAFVFGSTDTNSTGNYNAPLDSFPPTAGTMPVKTPFKIMNLTDTAQLTVRIREIPSSQNVSRKTGRWDFSEEIVLFAPSPVTTVHANVVFSKTNDKLASSIGIGNVFTLYTQRPFTTSDVFEFTADLKYGRPTDISHDDAVPKNYLLEQNFPNPFNPETTIRFSLVQSGRTTLKVYDAIGREIKILFDDDVPEGSYSVTWKGDNQFNIPVSSGMFFYRLQSAGFAQTRKMILLR